MKAPSFTPVAEAEADVALKMLKLFPGTHIVHDSTIRH